MNREKLKSPNFLNIIRMGLAFFLVFSSAVIIYSTARNFQTARLLADQSLENTALALSSTAEFSLRHEKSKPESDIRGIFSDRVVAYALIADDKGKILFHTNPGRIGSSLSSKEMAGLKGSRKISGRRILLGTGLPAYEFNYPLHLASGATEWLRIILHTTPADRIVSDASKMWWAASFVLLLLWTIGILFERVLTRSMKLREELDHKRHLALIGQMTALLAHEIRNALGSIKGYAQLVDEKIGPEDPKKTAMAFLLQGTARIEFLVQELLQFSREERYKLERVDVISLIMNSIQSTVSDWKGSWKLNDSPPVFATADAEMLRRVFTNGIQNAVQAMGEKGSLLVSVHNKGRWIRVRIEDTGPGIPADQKPLLFTPFHTTKTDGTGLGLAYSRKVMEGMKGKVELDNRNYELGAVLTIYIPKTGDS